MAHIDVQHVMCKPNVICKTVPETYQYEKLSQMHQDCLACHRCQYHLTIAQMSTSQCTYMMLIVMLSVVRLDALVLMLSVLSSTL